MVDFYSREIIKSNSIVGVLCENIDEFKYRLHCGCLYDFRKNFKIKTPYFYPLTYDDLNLTQGNFNKLKRILSMGGFKAIEKPKKFFPNDQAISKFLKDNKLEKKKFSKSIKDAYNNFYDESSFEEYKEKESNFLFENFKEENNPRKTVYGVPKSVPSPKTPLQMRTDYTGDSFDFNEIVENDLKTFSNSLYNISLSLQENMGGPNEWP